MGRSDETDRDAVMLEDVFAAARDEAPMPSEALLGRIMADADDVTRARDAARVAPVRRRGAFAAIAAAIGGWPALAGMATAAGAGVWIGVAQPPALSTLTGTMLTGTTTQYQLEEFAPGYAALVSFEEELAE